MRGRKFGKITPFKSAAAATAAVDKSACSGGSSEEGRRKMYLSLGIVGADFAF